MSSRSVTLVEMGLRDGLQNEANPVSTEDRIEFARRLSDAGLRRLEVGAFVHPRWVPQMAGSAEVLAGVRRLRQKGKIHQDSVFSVLVPNERGMVDAQTSQADEIAIFAAASESFSRKNVNCSIDESFQRFEPVMRMAKSRRMKVRGYLSTCFGCPFEGEVPQKQVLRLANRMFELGVSEISIGDTIGVANAGDVEKLFKKLQTAIPVKKLAGHFHDTRGQALANIWAAWSVGVRVFDTSLGGLGGCPYAPGATGNVATEDVVYLFEEQGVKTGIDLQKLIALNLWIGEKIGHPLPSKVGKVGLLKPLGRVLSCEG